MPKVSPGRHKFTYYMQLQIILATRGKPRRRGKDVRKLIVEPRREHSRKPDIVRERIERLVDGPYLELFACETKLSTGIVGAIKSACSIKARLQPGDSHLASLATLLPSRWSDDRCSCPVACLSEFRSLRRHRRANGLVAVLCPCRLSTP
jgi:hypothetical protein